MPNYRNDKDMIYDLDKHRYILRPEAMEKYYGINLSETLDTDGASDPEKVPEQFLDRVSLMLYTYIYSWAGNKDDTEFMISKEKYRDAIRDALKEYCYSLIMNNKDPNILFNGKTLSDLELPANVQNILRVNGVLFRGRFVIIEPNYREKKGIDY